MFTKDQEVQALKELAADMQDGYLKDFLAAAVEPFEDAIRSDLTLDVHLLSKEAAALKETATQLAKMVADLEAQRKELRSEVQALARKVVMIKNDVVNAITDATVELTRAKNRASALEESIQRAFNL